MVKKSNLLKTPISHITGNSNWWLLNEPNLYSYLHMVSDKTSLTLASVFNIMRYPQKCFASKKIGVANIFPLPGTMSKYTIL